MSATADTIWRVPAYLPYLQPPLTDEAIASAEKRIGYKLPSELVGLLRKQNGGYIRFLLPGMKIHKIITGIGPNYPSLPGRKWTEVQESVSFPLQGLIPFDGDGHWHLCLDYREKPQEPSISYIDVECDRQELIADCFAAYLGMLVLDVEDEYVLEDVADVEEVKTALSNVLTLKFYPPDSFAHGYTVHRAGFPEHDSPQWLWISPNTVARGFVRTNDRRYAELKDLMPGSAKRFPELPADSYIFEVTDKVLPSFLEACVRARFDIRPLREYMRGA